MKQLEFWPDEQRRTPKATDGSRDLEIARIETPCDLTELTIPTIDEPCISVADSTRERPPMAAPLPLAAEAGVFGMTLDGPILPDKRQIEELTCEHANEMIILLADVQMLRDAIRLEYDPTTGRTPATPEAKQSLLERLDKEWKRLLQAYDEAIGAYTEGFGDSAAKALDEWVRKTVADSEQRKEPYPPTHPWHYFHAGDHAPPIPVEGIPPHLDAGRWLAERLPKNSNKRLQVMREMLEREQASLTDDKARYVEIIQRGADALSRYDREIAHTSDAMAVATALALKYSHVSQGLGRICWLRERLRQIEPQ